MTTNINLKNVQILKNTGDGTKVLADNGIYIDVKATVEGKLNTFPTTGQSGVLYLDTDTDLVYRWNSTTYEDISNDYNKLKNKPTINNIPIVGNFTLDNNTMAMDSTTKTVSAKVWKGTKAQYDALTTKDDTMVYITTDEYSEGSKVTSSTTNGNIVVDGVETTVFNNERIILPDQTDGENGLQTIVYNGITYQGVLKITKKNMFSIIRMGGLSSEFHLMLTDEVRNIDIGFQYLMDSDLSDYIIDENFNKINVYSFVYGNSLENPISVLMMIINMPYNNGESYYMCQYITDNYSYIKGAPDVHTDIYNTLYLGGRNGNFATKNMIYNSSMLGKYLKTDGDNQLLCGIYNKVDADTITDQIGFVVGNGVTDTTRSNAFEVRKSGKVGIFNDIVIKAGTALKTVAQTIQGAINEIFDFAMPVYKGTLSFTMASGAKTYGTYVTHNLGYQPSRIEAYLHWEDINGETGSYKYQFPFQFFSHTDDPPLMYMLGQCGVSDTKINFWVQRFSSFATQSVNITIDYYLYK